LVRIDECADPIQMDYFNLARPCYGTVQYGLMKWVGDEPCFCMASSGQPRPSDFTASPGSGHTLSQWRLIKPGLIG
jgi:hypothetical protein